MHRGCPRPASRTPASRSGAAPSQSRLLLLPRGPGRRADRRPAAPTPTAATSTRSDRGSAGRATGQGVAARASSVQPVHHGCGGPAASTAAARIRRRRPRAPARPTRRRRRPTRRAPAGPDRQRRGHAGGDRRLGAHQPRGVRVQRRPHCLDEGPPRRRRRSRRPPGRGRSRPTGPTPTPRATPRATSMTAAESARAGGRTGRRGLPGRDTRATVWDERRPRAIALPAPPGVGRWRHCDDSCCHRPGPHPELLHHRPHRPWQVDAGRPDARGHRTRRGPPHARPVPRPHGHRARARHHHQGAERAAAVDAALRREHRHRVRARHDRHPGPRGLHLRGVPLAGRLRGRGAARRRRPGHRGPDAGQPVPGAGERPHDHPGAQQDRPAGRPARAVRRGDRAHHRLRARRRAAGQRQDRRRRPRAARPHRRAHPGPRRPVRRRRPAR